jgi:hypothetical protein
MDTKTFVDIGTANVEKPYELPIWPIHRRLQLGCPSPDLGLESLCSGSMILKGSVTWLLAKPLTSTTTKAMFLTSVCNHEALQWLSIFKAIQSWGYDNLDKVQGTVKTLAHMLQEDKLAIKQKLRHCRLSPANNVADKLELGTTMRWSRQLAQTPSGQGEQALEQVKALTTEAVQNTMQDAGILALSTGQEPPGLSCKPPCPAPAETTSDPEDTYLLLASWKTSIPWIQGLMRSTR